MADKTEKTEKADPNKDLHPSYNSAVAISSAAKGLAFNLKRAFTLSRYEEGFVDSLGSIIASIYQLERSINPLNVSWEDERRKNIVACHWPRIRDVSTGLRLIRNTHDRLMKQWGLEFLACPEPVGVSGPLPYFPQQFEVGPGQALIQMELGNFVLTGVFDPPPISEKDFEALELGTSFLDGALAELPGQTTTQEVAPKLPDSQTPKHRPRSASQTDALAVSILSRNPSLTMKELAKALGMANYRSLSNRLKYPNLYNLRRLQRGKKEEYLNADRWEDADRDEDFG